MNYIIQGGNRLEGTVEVGSAKNSVLELLACTILADGVTRIINVEPIEDVVVMIDIMRGIGCRVSWDNADLVVDTSSINTTIIPTQLAMKLRGSIFLIGALLGRFGSAYTCMPGGCAIGSRPIDIHIDGLTKLNVDVEIDGYCVNCNCRDIIGNDIYMRMPSVGATVNIVMCSVLGKGRTRIFNCAREPEVVCLMQHLVRMGATIHGIGTADIVIEGVEKLHPIIMTPITDRIISATYLVAGAMTRGDVYVTNCNVGYLTSLIKVLEGCGVQVLIYDNGVRVISKGYRGLGRIITAPYPDFATDMQSLVLAMATVAQGSTDIVENMFEHRLVSTARELAKLGANITTEGNTAMVKGVDNLYGSEVICQDLRGGASLVLAGLVAQGVTVVKDIHHIQRGYYNIAKVINELGGNISS